MQAHLGPASPTRLTHCLAAWLALIVGVAFGFAGAEAGSGTAFSQIAESYLEAYLAWRPQAAVALGFHRYDGRITDYSAASLQAERARLDAAARHLEQLDRAALTPEEAWDLQVLEAGIQRERFQFDGLRAYGVNPMTYAGALDVNLYLKRKFAPLPERVRAITAVLEQAPQVMRCARENLESTLPKPYVETAIEIAQGNAAFLENDLVSALREFHDPQLRPRLDLARQRAVGELRAFVEYLKVEKLPRATARFAIGRDQYVRMLVAEQITQSPEQILEQGRIALRREQDAFAATARRIDPSRSPVEVYRAIQKDHPTEQSLLPDTRKNLEAIRQFLIDHDIVTIPSEIRPQVEETPPFERATSFASMDTPGPFETRATEAFYYVTPVEAGWTEAQKEEWLTAFNYYTTDIVSVHEVYPGHYVQALWLNSAPLTRVKKILSSYAFTEGWAHYTEQMMIEAGFGRSADPGVVGARSDPDLRAAKFRLAQQGESLLRLCRLCVSVQLHCQGMSVDDATRFFSEQCYYEEKPARQEALRGTYDPGYLFYALGKLMLLELRAECRSAAGPRFNLKSFHDEVLAHGAPPIPLLRARLLSPGGLPTAPGAASDTGTPSTRVD